MIVYVIHVVDGIYSATFPAQDFCCLCRSITLAGVWLKTYPIDLVFWFDIICYRPGINGIC